MATEGVAKTGRKGRPNYPLDFKRELAVKACEPNVSVAKLALRHGINANVLFKWRRHYRAGLFDVSTMEPTAQANLIPIVSTALPERKAALAAKRSEPIIEMAIGAVTLRLRGGVDPILLSTVLDCLAQRR